MEKKQVILHIKLKWNIKLKINKQNVPEDPLTLLKLVKSITSDDYWSIILVAAGHFAAAVFKGDTVINHKTFHRYVVRAKRGTVQSQHDSSGKHAKSAGANIRRSQEAAFKDVIILNKKWLIKAY